MPMIRPQQLESMLARGVKPVYAVLAEEPLQALEACDAIRLAARKTGYLSRTILDLSAAADWSLFDSAIRDRSLFSARELIDLRLPTGKPGKQGGERLRRYLLQPEPDLLLLLQLPRPDKDMRRASWFKALDAHAVIVHAQPVPPARLGSWIEERLARQGLRIARDALALLASNVEGNLLAARQEVEKLALLGYSEIGLADVQLALSDVARFDLSALSVAALRGEAQRALRIVRGMLDEGHAEPLLLWVLNRDIRALAQAAERVQEGRSLADATRGFWGTDTAALTAALQRFSFPETLDILLRAAFVDRVIKGRATGDTARELTDLVMALSGHGERKRKRE